MFIVSLAISDLIVGGFVMPISAIYILTTDWYFGAYVCQIWLAVDYTASTASIFNLFILSLDRYWSVTSPLKYLRRRTKKRAVLLIGLVWLISSLWIIPIFGWQYFRNGGERRVPGNTCDTEFASDMVLKIITAIFNFYLPLSIMFILYGRIFQEIKKRTQFEVGQTNSGGQKKEVRTCFYKNDDHQNHTNVQKVCRKKELSGCTDRSSGSSDSASQEMVERLPVDGSNNIIHSSANSNHSSSSLRRCRAICIKDKIGECDRFETQKSLRFNIMEDVIYVYDSDSPSANGSEPNHNSTSTRNKEYNGNVLKGSERTDVDNQIIGSESRHEHRRHQNGSIPCKFCNKGRYPRTTTFPLKGNKQQVSTTKKKNLFLQKEIKAARQLGVIMGAFTLCFLPYFIVFMVVSFCEDCVDPGILIALTWVGYLNSTLNPFLYAMCNIGFRRKFKRMFQTKWRRRAFSRNRPSTNTTTKLLSLRSRPGSRQGRTADRQRMNGIPVDNGMLD